METGGLLPRCWLTCMCVPCVCPVAARELLTDLSVLHCIPSQVVGTRYAAPQMAQSTFHYGAAQE